MFFHFRYSSSRARGYPWVMSARSMAGFFGTPCPSCGRTILPHDEEVVLTDIHKGTKWPDIVGSGSPPPPFFISEHVIRTFEREGVTGYEARPAIIEAGAVKSKKLKAIRPPKYFFLEVTGRIDIDLEASGLAGPDICPVCFRREGLREPERIVPRPETWDGSDIFRIRNYSFGTHYCTEKVLLLARENRWTNFRFEPMDAIQRYATGWKGIDYLGKRWPPKWYPDPPDKCKSLDEWLVDFEQIPAKVFYPAHQALMEIGQPAVPRLVELLKNESPKVRYRAANALRALKNRGASIPVEVEGTIERELKKA